MLGMLEGSGIEKAGAGSAAEIHYWPRPCAAIFADRSQYLGDPDFVKDAIDGSARPRLHLSGAALASTRSTPRPARKSIPGQPAGREGDETTHYTVVDAQGNAVAVTYTLNGGYGSGITVPGLGFLLNNEMDDFAAKPGAPNMFGLMQGEANAIQPGKRPLSSMTPTIVLRDGKPFMAVGAPGGSRIITAVLQVILNVIDFGMNAQDAVDCAALPSSMAARQAVSGTRLFAGYGRAARSARLRRRPFAGVVLARVEAIVNDGGWLQGGSDGRARGRPPDTDTY